jgi:lipid A 3-O-deacylase
MYTPAALETRRPMLGDRPYGGWLHGTMMFDAIRDRDADHIEVSLGVIGSHSLAERAQIFIHDHVTPWADDPLGWDNQIGEWPAVLVGYEHSIKLLPQETSSGLKWFDITPALGGAAGNVFIRGTATAAVRLGYNLPQRFIRPIQGAPLADTFEEKTPDEGVARKWDLYFFGGGNVSYVARNIFIDAEDTTYRIEREPNVQSYHAGASFRIGWFRLAYQHTWRSPEFKALVRRSPVTGQSWDTVLVSVGPHP